MKLTGQKIAVVGTGTIGAQVLWQLAKKNVDVTGYELYSPGHSRGAAGGETRLFRHLEPEYVEYLPVTSRADEIWNELEMESGSRLRNLNGALMIGSESSPSTANALGAADRLGSGAEVFTRSDSQKRFPQYSLNDDEIAILDKAAGTIYPERTVRAAADAAAKRGARIVRECRVDDIQQESDRVSISTGDETELYDRVIVAAGAWTSILLPDMAQFLATRRLLSGWFLPAAGKGIDGMLPFMRLDPNYSYGLPTADGLAMKLGVGFPHHLPVATPDTAPMRITDADLEPVRAVAKDLFPDLDDYPMRAQAYFEAYTHSRREYMNFHPTMSNVFVCAGFSGKGFKNSPFFGELAADTILGRKPSIPEAQFILDFDHVAQLPV
ncbi:MULTISPECIES: FAD-dependent oxidoreductase [unclassified Brevibacterium]|uniref:FAD-dependent oxidoreductase n=1 Tax=unclassified Brevibacterium TaxID=2614124 RepID=UPI001F19369D|nr:MULTISPECIES: FAD-dependent oxidoreductase [unclassified Brevibacterium]MCF2588667.1 FAD-dependent oxidoreductase [Brevibacterium sp. UCMA 11752]